MRRHFWQMFSLLLISVWLGWGLFHTGWFISHDGIFHVRRSAEMVEMLKAGYFPVRYGSSLDNNFGIPLFNYVYPGPYYLSAIVNLLTGIGLPTILKLLMFSSLIVGALGWYSYFKERKEIAWIAGLVSLFTPYFLVNIYVRADLGESIALALLPWVFLMQKKVLETGKINWYTPIPLFLALICHNFIGYFMLPILFLNVFLSSKHRMEGVCSLVLGIGLASLFWIPMLFERQFLLSGITGNFSFPYTDHFVALWQFFVSPWGYGYSMPGVLHDGFTFQIGFVPLLGIVLALCFSLLNLRARSQRRTLYFCLIIFFLIFCMTSWSTALWGLFPLLKAVQFPWRLLGLVGVLAPFVVGLSLQNIKSQRSLWSLAIVFLAIGIFNTYSFRAPAKYLSRAEFSEAYALWQNGTTTSFRDEIVPRWAPSEHTSVSPETGSDFKFTKEVSDPTVYIFPKNYFPSWKGEIDGKPMILSPSPDGEISFTLLPGRHVYHLYLGSTNLEDISNLLTLLSLGLLLYLMRYTN